MHIHALVITYTRVYNIYMNWKNLQIYLKTDNINLTKLNTK